MIRLFLHLFPALFEVLFKLKAWRHKNIETELVDFSSKRGEMRLAQSPAPSPTPQVKGLVSVDTEILSASKQFLMFFRVNFNGS